MSDDEKNSEVPEYKVGKKVALDELLKQDQDDESLRKYKESLLGKLDDGAARMVFLFSITPFSRSHTDWWFLYVAKDDPRRVVVKEMAVLFEDRPGGDILYPLESAAELEKMKKTPFLLKEGCHYKIRVTFRVQHDIVSGLKYVNSVYRKGIKGMWSCTWSGMLGGIPVIIGGQCEGPYMEWWC